MQIAMLALRFGVSGPFLSVVACAENHVEDVNVKVAVNITKQGNQHVEALFQI